MPTVPIAATTDDGHVATVGTYTYVHPPPPPPAEGHAYYEWLGADPRRVHAYSLRDPEQLLRYCQSRSKPPNVTYDYAGDPDPRRQDAAKVVIPRGHNSLPNQIHLPIQWPRQYGPLLITWDGWMGREFEYPGRTNIPNYKHFQVCSPAEGIWCEVRSRFVHGQMPTTLATIDGRGYSYAGLPPSETFGPNVTRLNPLSPQSGTFAYPPETWVRYWALVEPAGDYDLYSLWVATAAVGPVRLYDRREFKMRPNSAGVRQIGLFRLEFNTSEADVLPERGDLVAYVRNVVALQDVTADTIQALLVQP